MPDFRTRILLVDCSSGKFVERGPLEVPRYLITDDSKKTSHAYVEKMTRRSTTFCFYARYFVASPGWERCYTSISLLLGFGVLLCIVVVLA